MNFSHATSAIDSVRPLLFGAVALDAPLRSRANRGEPTGVSSRILIVDDDAGVRNVLAKMVASTGYRVVCADNGAAGWEALCAEDFDLVLTDHDMPRLTGMDLLRRVRTVSPLLPVIMISGRIPWEEEDLLTLLSPGLALEKPFSFADLRGAICSLLNAVVRTAPEDRKRVSCASGCGPSRRSVAGVMGGGRAHSPLRSLILVG